jgi:HEAT repeat protein
MPRHKRTDAEIERLKRIGDTAGLVRALDTSDPELRRAAIDALVATGVPVIPVLLREFSAPGNRAVKDGAGEVIRHLGKGAFGALRKVLKHEDERVRASAATAIGYTGEIAVPSLVEALDDPSKEVKSRAARSLEGIGWAPPPGQVQKHVIFHLFRGGMPELIRIRKSAFPHLITLLGENDYRTRIEVIRVLGRIRMPRGVPHLVLALSDNESDVRAAAAEALGEIGNIRVRPFLVRAMSDPAQNVRVEAVLALEKTGWRPEKEREKVRKHIEK